MVVKHLQYSSEDIKSAARFSVAPMMDWTDRHDRVFLRKFSKNILLYTEMITSASLEYGDAEYLLKYNEEEHPVALQIGGSKLDELSHGAILGERAGFDEINLLTGFGSSHHRPVTQCLPIGLTI